MEALDYREPQAKVLHGAQGDWEIVIGMEVHAQVLSKSKLFSGASTAFGSEPNTNVSLVDAAMPGMLPVINDFCVEQAVRAGLGLNAQINLRSVFDRKNYFYPDLPQGYQISQFKHPIVGEGEVLVDMEPGVARRVRADVNVSVCKPGDYERFREADDFSVLGTRCEIKNMNSMRFIQAAIDYEARRQIAILEDGGSVDQETRLYDPSKGETRSMRSKEEAHDYRYFPDPDLLPLEIDEAYVARVRDSLPELPDAKKLRFVTAYAMTEYDASVLTAEHENAAFFEAVAEGRDGKQAANWVINELFGRLNKAGLTVETSPLSPAQVGGVIDLVAKGEISGAMAKQLFDLLWEQGGEPAEVAAANGLKQVTDTGEIEAAVDAVIAANPDKVAQAQEKPSLAGWFVGQVMKSTGGKANPKAVNEIVRAKLGV